jgi:hypothetical protein
MAQRLIYHWRHGWIPLDHYAALSKAHGREDAARKLLPGHSTGKSAHLENRLQASHSVANPVGKDFRTMTSAEKIKAAEIMFGTGSKQHQAAKKKFGGKSAA